MIAEFIVSLNRGEKITGDKFGALMNQLVEGVLTVGSRFTPDNWAGAEVNFFAFAGDALTIAFHVTLLEVSRKTRKVLVVGQDGLCLCAEEIVVPDADQRQDDR